MAPDPRARAKHLKRRGKAGPPRSAVRAAQAKVAAVPSSDIETPSPSTKRKRAANAEVDREAIEPDTELEFEDPYGDEYEDEDVDPNADTRPPGEIVNPMMVNDAVVFRPGKDTLGEGEQLVCDESAYELFHKCTVEWPALSFDFVCMSADGQYNNLAPAKQETYPLDVSMILGTQADVRSKNKLVCVRLSNIHRTSRNRRKPGKVIREQDSDDSSDEDDENDESEMVAPDRNALLQSAEIKIDSTVNRVRVMPQHSNIVAAWGESGRVSLVDAEPALNSLNLDSRRRMSLPSAKSPSSVRPFYTFKSHGVEGFALDWSIVTEGRLLSGALNGSIYLTEPSSRNGADWTTSPDRYQGHNKPVEDIQWSPNERDVFASCSSDKSIRVWDARERRKPVLSVPIAHDADVNVISWNRNETHLMISGGDEGTIKVWDMRSLTQGDNESAKAAAEFKHHTKAITSVQWHPTDASMLCASSEDGSISVWDLAVERDAEEELREGVVLTGADEFPPQLLFIHMGQKDVKDAQWHPGCTSLIASTAEDGLNLFQPTNITLPS